MGTKEGEFGVTPFEFPLYEHNPHKPVWREHSKFGSSCDVIAIPMERPESCPNFMHNAANCINTIRIPVKPGCTVFFIEFPRAISVGFGLPIWKSGYIASEPHYDVTLGGEVRKFGGLEDVNDQAVEDGVGEGGIAEYVSPLLDRELTGDQGGVAVLEEFEQVAPIVAVSDVPARLWSPVG